jgi:pyruvate,water dikinase
MPLPPYPFDYSLFFRPILERASDALGALGLALPPVDEVFVEVAEGVVQMVPPVIRPTPKAITLPVKVVASLWADPEGWLAECRRTLVEPARQIDRDDLSRLSEPELLRRIETLQHLQLQLAIPRFGYFLRGLLVSQGLKALLRIAVGAQARALERDLLAAVPCTTTLANAELGRLAQRIRDSEELRQIFGEERPERLPSRTGESLAGRHLAAAIDAFLQRFGYRETAMPSAALPAWRDDPSLVYGLLKGRVVTESVAISTERDESARVEAAKRRAVAALSQGVRRLAKPLLVPLFQRLLRDTRAFIAFREDSHYYLMLPFPVIRRLALELGRRLVSRGVLDSAEDIFLLELNEVKTAEPTGMAREIVRSRAAARRSVMGRYTTVPPELLEQGNPTGDIRGAPVSPGRAIGRVRILRSERDFWKLEKGEVLVAHYTNPSWTPLFSLASAVVVDAGGAASHAAIVAREYGIPGVMGTGGATTRLRDGQRVLVDGDAGRVVLLTGDVPEG